MKQYKVGYKSPPKAYQFKKGRSGNPAGRPKKKLSLAELFQRELTEKITLTERGKSKQITKSSALVKQLVNSGLKGDLKAMKILLPFLQVNPSTEEHDYEELTKYLENLNG